MAIQIKNIKDDTFGRCVSLSNGIVTLQVTADYGPRVIYFARNGKENMFYQDKKKTPLGEKLDVYGGDQLILYGGHRIWISPEELPRCYHPDNAPVSCTPVENGMSFAAAEEKVNHIRKIMTITLVEDAPIVKVQHAIENTGAWDIEFAPWCITMMDKGGKSVIPMPDRKTGLLSNRNLSLWDYSAMNDPRVCWGENFITLRQDVKNAHPFKLGLNNEHGWAAYFNKGQVFLKFFEPYVDGDYPDNGCSYETYTNDLMLEMESLGEFVQLPPGESITHEEEWELYDAAAVPGDETAIKAVMDKLL